MPKIVLIRHVTPIVNSRCCGANEAKQYLTLYNQTDKLQLEETDMFQQTEIYQDISNIRKILVSPLIRAQKTAEKLFPHKPFDTIDQLHEFNLNIMPLPLLKCPLCIWFALSRILWFFGLNKAENNYSREKQRIRQIIPMLLKENCIIVSHGFVLNEIKKVLNKQKFIHLFHQKQGCFTVDIFNQHEERI